MKKMGFIIKAWCRLNKMWYVSLQYSSIRFKSHTSLWVTKREVSGTRTWHSVGLVPQPRPNGRATLIPTFTTAEVSYQDLYTDCCKSEKIWEESPSHTVHQTKFNSSFCHVILLKFIQYSSVTSSLKLQPYWEGQDWTSRSNDDNNNVVQL